MRCRALFILLLVLLLYAPSGLADDKSVRAEGILKRAFEVSNVNAAGVGPYELKADLKVTTGKRSVVGTYRVLGTGRRVREELNLPGYQEVRWLGEGKYWRLRPPNVRYPPAHAAFAAMRFRRPLPGTPVAKIVDREQDGRGLTCVVFADALHYEFCVDRATGALVFARSRAEVEAFSEFVDFRGKQIPRSLGRKDHINITEARITTLGPLTESDPKLFDPPADAEEWETCANPQPPKLLSRFPLSLRPGFGRSGKENEAVVLLVITKNGDVADVTLGKSVYPQLGEDALAAISKWKYQPAMCGDRPIRSELEVDLTAYQSAFK